MRKFLKTLGPGIVVAATGVGAGDMIAASVAGAKYGTIIIWAAVVPSFFGETGMDRNHLFHNRGVFHAFFGGAAARNE